MTGERRAWLDRCPGETRGVVTLDGRPERLILLREDDPTPRLGQRFAARVEAVSARMGLARLDLGATPGTLRLRGLAAAPHVGQRLLVEVVAEPAGGKPALVRAIDGTAPAGVNEQDPPTSVDAQLAALGFTTWETGDPAREAADDAQAEALACLHAIGGGVTLAIEPTRALTAVDVDLAQEGACVSVARANVSALGQAARLLRLKALGGLIVIDLIGFPKDAKALLAEAARAFGPDGPQVGFAGPSRFGVLEIAKPRLRQPLHEQLGDTEGRLSPRTTAQDLVRALERQGRFQPGARIEAICTPQAAKLAAPYVARLGPRYTVRGDVGFSRARADIRIL